MEAGVRGEAALGVEAHANSHFESTADRLAFGGHAGASAKASLMVEGDLKAETANGSSLSATGGTTWGSVGAGAGGDFSRSRGETSLGAEASGAILGGAHFNVQANIKDRDIAEASTLPLRGLAGAYNVIGDGAEAVGDVTESAKQSANQRQELIQRMADTPTGNFVTDFGLDAASRVHGAYTGAMNLADNLVDEVGAAYDGAGDVLGRTTSALTDRVECVVGSTLDAGVRQANTAYRAGREVVGGMAESIGHGARALGSALNPFD